MPRGKVALVEVTNSEVQAAGACRKLWWFSHHERLRPKRVKKPLGVGSAVHAGLCALYLAIRERQRAESHASDGARFAVQMSADECSALAVRGVEQKLSRYLQQLYEDMVASDDADAIQQLAEESKATEREVVGSVERYAALFGPLDAERYLVLDAERPFRVPLLSSTGAATVRSANNGVLDLVLYDPLVKDLVLGEHKTSGMDARLAEKRLDMDPQTSGYVWVLRQVVRGRHTHVRAHDFLCVPQAQRALVELPPSRAEHVTGRVFYNVLCKKGPRTPSWTKAGMVSAALVDTTRDVYEQMLLRQETVGGPREDGKPQEPKPRTDKQAELLANLPTALDKWVMRHEVAHSVEEQERWRGETVQKAGEIRMMRAGRLPVYRNPNHCNMPWSMACTYRELCRHDSPQLREMDFYVVGSNHAEVEEAKQERADDEV